MFRKIATFTILSAFVLVGCSSSKKSTKDSPKPTEHQMKTEKKKKMAKKARKKKKDNDDKDKKKKKHKHLFKSFKKLDGFKASATKKDGKAVVVLAANKHGLKDLKKKGKKLAMMMNKKHKKKAKHKKRAKKHKKKKHHKKMKAVHRATIEYTETDTGAEIMFTPEKSKDLDYLMDYANWKAKLLNAGGCKKCAGKGK